MGSIRRVEDPRSRSFEMVGSVRFQASVSNQILGEHLSEASPVQEPHTIQSERPLSPATHMRVRLYVQGLVSTYVGRCVSNTRKLMQIEAPPVRTRGSAKGLWRQQVTRIDRLPRCRMKSYEMP